MNRWGGQIHVSVPSCLTRLLVVAGIAGLTGMLVGCTSATRLGPPVTEPVVVRQIRQTITIDGDIDDWPDRPTVRIARSDPPPEGARARIGFGWDETHLYVAFIVSDLNLVSTETRRDARGLRDDGVMLLIDTLADHKDHWRGDDIFYRVNLTGTVVDARGLRDKSPNTTWDGGMKHAVTLQGTLNNNKDVDTGYIIEMAVPWTDIGITKPMPGKAAVGVNMVVYTRGAQEEDFGFYDWAKGPGLLRPDTFGKIVLSK